MNRGSAVRILASVCLAVLCAGCASVPIKRYYTLNYIPILMADRQRQGPYPFVIRVRDLSIEEAYARPQIVYRQSPFELDYYFYRVWAVKPTRMVTDLLHKHLVASELVSSVVRRFDEGAKPYYELSGTIEAIEEYDSGNLWFAHLALHLRMARISDGRTIYSRRFDHRKQMFENRPEILVREMSAITEYILNQTMRDLDAVFARELGMNVPAPETAVPDSTTDAPEIWK